MPSRIIREGYLESSKVNSLSPQAEVFFVRLMLKADDFGRYHAHPSLLRANLYPLKIDSIREADISRWITEVEKAGLIALYEASIKRYLVIRNFGQRTRAKESRFPAPPDSCLADAGHMPVKCQSRAHGGGDGDDYSESLFGDGDVGANESPPPDQLKAGAESDEAWLSTLQKGKAYKDFDVLREYAKMIEWCRISKKQPTRRRFINWLNRCEKPMKASNCGQKKESIYDSL